MVWKTNPPWKRGRWVGPGVCMGTHRGSVWWTCAGLFGSAASLCNLATTEAHRGLGIQNQLRDEMKVEFQEFRGRRVCTDVLREGAPLEYADHPPAATPCRHGRGRQGLGLDTQSAAICIASSVSPWAGAAATCYPSSDSSDLTRITRPKPVSTTGCSVTGDGGASATSACAHAHPPIEPSGAKGASALPWGALRRETTEQPGTGTTPWTSPQRSVLGWNALPAQSDGPKLMNQVHWTPVTVLEVEEDMWIEVDQRCCGSSRLTITSGKTSGSQLVCSRRSGVSSLAILMTTSRHSWVSPCQSSLVWRRPRWLGTTSFLGIWFQIRSGAASCEPRWRNGPPFWALPRLPTFPQRQLGTHENTCSTESYLWDTSSARNPGQVSEPRQKPHASGVSLNIVTLRYASWNDLLQRHKHPQSALSCSSQQASTGKLPSGISLRPSCRATRVLLTGQKVNSMRAFSLEAFLSPTGYWMEEASLIQLNAAV